MIPLPFPGDDATTLSAVETVVLEPGQKATVEFTPEQSGTRVYLPAVAVSKHPTTHYRIKGDSNTLWDAAIPPTDIDDLSAPWIPVRSFSTSLEVEVAYLAESGGAREYHIQPVGWEQ